jgi:aldehyde:ferredoxin oxidoreductase
MVGGYTGKILNVDLTTGQLHEETLEESLLRNFIGGAGLGARLLFSRQKAKVDPLGPENILGIAPGPFTGTPVPYSGRYQVFAKSPLTGCWGDANSGGQFGPRLKFAGFDMLLFHGVSERPVYLLVDNGRAELKDASHLWGKDTFQTEAALEKELGRGISVCSIGPAGEMLSLLSSVMNDRGRAAARSGLGAVMGSKRLKAVVARGNARVEVADRDKLSALRPELVERTNHPDYHAFFKMHKKFGNIALLRSWAKHGGTPAKNYASLCAVDFPDADQCLGTVAVMPYQEKIEACWGCPCGCGGRLKAGEGEYVWEAGAAKPEYESLAFGYRCQNRNIESVLKACDITNRAGLDHCSAAAAISFAMECYENGIITRQEADGVELNWGNHRAVVAMAEKMARREGLGALLADGVRIAAEKIGRGAEQYAMHVHGQEIDSTGPLWRPGFAVMYVMDATPGRHTVGSTGYIEPEAPPRGLGIGPQVNHVYTGKGEANRRMNGFNNLLQCLGVCQFSAYHGVIDGETMPSLFRLVMGWDVDIDELLETGDRIAAIRMAFTIREGINPVEDFRLPGRLIGHPQMTRGPLAWVEVDLNTMVREYLQAMRWDQATARPTRERLQELGLADVATVLWH